MTNTQSVEADFEKALEALESDVTKILSEYWNPLASGNTSCARTIMELAFAVAGPEDLLEMAVEMQQVSREQLELSTTVKENVAIAKRVLDACDQYPVCGTIIYSHLIDMVRKEQCQQSK